MIFLLPQKLTTHILHKANSVQNGPNGEQFCYTALFSEKFVCQLCSINVIGQYI